MSNELAILDAELPSYLRNTELDEATKSLMGNGGGSLMKRISIKGGVWRMMVGGKEIIKNEDRTLNVVIAAAAPKVSRQFYLKQYVEGSTPTPPDCWSNDGEVPDAKAALPQAKRCMDCPQNIEGSGQGKSRACKSQQRIAVLLANDLKGDVFALTCPSTSVFGEGANGKWPLRMYSRLLGGKGIPITAVVTEMRFDTEAATPKITFRPVRVLKTEEHELVIEKSKTEDAKRAVTMTVAEVDSFKPKQLTIEAATAEVVSTPVEEPVKRTSKKEEAPAEKKDLAKILAEWDDE